METGFRQRWQCSLEDIELDAHASGKLALGEEE
ncbi:UNVERIFIED_ORG: hypothetical protein M2312_004839 [Rhizobium esperanzae]|nr:hypothetical protein [Rhizobium esperanzae]